MKIIYIHHSTFCVEIEGRVLVFDYYSGSGVPGCTYHGKMPQYPKETPVYVFSSHSHRDHFDAQVMRWQERYRNIHYIFAKEVKRKLGNSQLRRLGCGESVKEAITYVKPKERCQVGEAAVETLLSTDSGVAFLVTILGKTIYHAGDLNWWRWEGESEEFNRYQEQTYKQQIDLLRGRRIDLSFVAADPRLGDSQFLGIEYYMRQVESGYVVPMHVWKQYEGILEYRDKLGEDHGAKRMLVFDQENQELLV